MNANKPFVLGLSGLSGAGKTFYIQHLKSLLKMNLSILTFDDYYKPFSEQKVDENGVPNFDLPSALNIELYINHLKSLMEGQTVRKEQYQFELENPEMKILEIPSAPVIIAEGLFVYEIEEIRDLLDYKIFLTCDESLCLERRLKRDTEERGIPKERSTYQWDAHVLPAYKQFIKPYQSMCDVTYHNEGSPEDNLKQLTKIVQERTTILN